ncbi:MAG: YfhO family protein, partial [Lachnospiraceae bacterium]|nr:YfhO family protein [Lachnospiraceae bacterium]
MRKSGKVSKKDIDLTWFKTHSGGCMLALSFVLPVFVMLVSYNASAIYPFGEDRFQYMDFYHQYLQFFTEFVRSVRSGRGIFYSWNMGLGTNFLALYGYYLASPLHLLGLLVPESHLGDFLAYLVVCKAGLCGLTTYLYLNHRGTHNVSAHANR